MPRDVEQLGQAQHDIPNGLRGCPYLDGFGTEPGSGDRQGGQQKGVTLVQRAIDLRLQDLAAAQCAKVVLAEDVASHFQAQTHVHRVVVWTTVERGRVIVGSFR